MIFGIFIGFVAGFVTACYFAGSFEKRLQILEDNLRAELAKLKL